jgi:NAD(P)-dependent dehydrogenase (short-subunit alcohol dehydrogenase family)
MELKGRVALVTGAGSGLGKAAALRLAQAGARVGVLSHTAAEVEATAGEIRRAGGEALALDADVRDAEAMRGAIDRLAETYGRLDVMFVNAGINGHWAPLDELTPEEWSLTVDTNLTGSFLTLRYGVPHLKRAGGGSIIVTSSINGTRVFSNPGTIAYACTKAAQVAMAKIAAIELAQHKIRVNVICPGWIESEIEENTWKRDLEQVDVQGEPPGGKIPLSGGEPGKAEDVAELVLFLASDRSRHVTGTPIWIDGAESLLLG